MCNFGNKVTSAEWIRDRSSMHVLHMLWVLFLWNRMHPDQPSRYTLLKVLLQGTFSPFALHHAVKSKNRLATLPWGSSLIGSTAGSKWSWICPIGPYFPEKRFLKGSINPSKTALKENRSPCWPTCRESFWHTSWKKVCWNKCQVSKQRLGNQPTMQISS